MEHVANVINLISKNDSVERFTTLGVNVINAHAEFIDEKTIQAGHTIIQARKIVIASGSKPSVPLIPGLDSVSYLTNETIFTLCEKPSHLIVIGAGPIGCELAQANRKHKRIASEFYAPKLFSDTVRRVVLFLKYLG